MLTRGINPLCKTMLRQARAAEQGLLGAGETYLNSIEASLAAVIAAGGQQMLSASTAGKAFSFGAGWTNQAVADALDEAKGIWGTYTSDQLSAVLDVRPVTAAVATFGVVPFRYPYGSPGTF